MNETHARIENYKSRDGLQLKRRAIRRIVATLSSVVTVVAVVTGTLIVPRVAHADTPVTPPDSCFAFTSGTGTITGYYDNEGNNGANPACPRAIAIPTTIGGAAVTSIGDYAFSYNQLTSLTIPGSVTSIGDWAFEDNQLTSVSLSEGLQTIGLGAFAGNKLTEVTLPSTLTSLDPTAFSYQNPWGGTVELNTDPTHYMWSSDPAIVQSVYDSMWYVRLHTADPSNPQGFTSGDPPNP